MAVFQQWKNYITYEYWLSMANTTRNRWTDRYSDRGIVSLTANTHTVCTCKLAKRIHSDSHSLFCILVGWFNDKLVVCVCHCESLYVLNCGEGQHDLYKKGRETE